MKNRFINAFSVAFIAFYGFHELFFSGSIFNTSLSIAYLILSFFLVLYLLLKSKKEQRIKLSKNFVNYIIVLTFLQCYFSYKDKFETYELVVMITIAVLTSMYIILGVDLNKTLAGSDL